MTSSLTSGVGVPVDAIACMHMHTSMRTLTLHEWTHYAQICTEAGLPPGVFNVITGGGAMGSKMAAHPLVDKVGCSWPDSLLGLVVLAAAVNSRYCSPRLRCVVLPLGWRGHAALVCSRVGRVLVIAPPTQPRPPQPMHISIITLVLLSSPPLHTHTYTHASLVPTLYSGPVCWPPSKRSLVRPDHCY